MHKRTVFCRNIQRYWILRRICRSISCSASLDQNSNRPYNTSLLAYHSQWVVTFMTKLLEEAFAEAAKLSAQEQDALAAVILEELASERRWDQAFADSADLLAQLAEQALAEHRAGKTQRLDPERL